MERFKTNLEALRAQLSGRNIDQNFQKVRLTSDKGARALTDTLDTSVMMLTLPIIEILT